MVFERHEPYEGKLSRTALGGGEAGNSLFLLGYSGNDGYRYDGLRSRFKGDVHGLPAGTFKALPFL
jgi:hypothetical protein